MEKPKPDNNQNQNLIQLILGKKGKGKTYLTQNRIIKRFKRVVIIDSQSEYGFMTFGSINGLYEAVRENINADFFYLNYRPYDEQPEAFFEIVENMVDTTIVVEEADLYCNAHSIDPNLNRIIQYGRHSGQNLILVSRRPASINVNIRSQTDVVLTFQQTERNDLEFFKYYMDDPQLLKKLKPREYIIVSGQEDFSKAIGLNDPNNKTAIIPATNDQIALVQPDSDLDATVKGRIEPTSLSEPPEEAGKHDNGSAPVDPFPASINVYRNRKNK